jgi:hypothetical protein
LLQRIEASRRALPANNMKPLWKSRELAPAPAAQSAPRARSAENPLMIDATLDPYKRVVPLARAAGSIARPRDGISVSAA